MNATVPGAVSAARWKRTLPNALTIARLGLAAVFFVILSIDHVVDRPVWLVTAAVVFVVAATTDALDGYLARRWHVVSRFGRIADPFADKVLVLGAFVMLAGSSFSGPHTHAPQVEAWMAVVILGRELLVTSLRAMAEGAGVDFSALSAGKIKMIVQSLAVPAILLVYAFSEHHVWVSYIAWATTIITVLSAWPYIAKAARMPR
ncbi:MAG: CDP-diacylglycerol--glycerol-3-phosphate 3-phosphatidyltransferase [Phycisphaeraceae bacterium]|nr:CDP-diacylglycerol--glycerol-3-phosphate 3-phosphatidyltransferase [Phycisphaeraceae bacterium]MCW5755515.1 CDP-diacylglycerol--glycerol-3-phosphate 3-phosphatidyltransferase [Phycisphaeraceae bacterium]